MGDLGAPQNLEGKELPPQILSIRVSTSLSRALANSLLLVLTKEVNIVW